MARRKPQQQSDLSRWAPWFVGLLTLLVFLPSVGNDFVNWDDDRNFLDNPDYRGLGPSQIAWAFQAFVLGHYHPLAWLSSSLDYVLWGMNPAGYHFSNVVLHAITAVLVFLLFVELLKKALNRESSPQLVWAAAAGALLFSLHPLRVESVTWASERRDVLCGVFYAGTLLLYIRGKVSWAIAAFAGALLSKILAVTLPLVLLLIDFYPLRRRFNWCTLSEKLPFFALAAVAGFYALTRTTGSFGSATADVGLYPDLRIGLSVYGLAFYLLKTLVPISLYPQYVYSLEPLVTDPRTLGAAVFVLVVTALAIWQWKTRPWIVAVWGAYVVTLLPVLSLLRLDRQQVVADHHTYLATLGVACLVAGTCLLQLEKHNKSILPLAAVTLTVLSGLTVYQIRHWSDSKALWSRTVEGQPLSIVAHNNLGRAVLAEGDAAAAMQHFERAVELDPQYAQAQYNLGSLQMQLGSLTAAEASLRAAVEREPRLAQAQNALGNCLLRQQRLAEAVPHYEAALEAAPGYADAHYNFGVALEYLGRSLEAVYHYRLAAQFDPSNTDALEGVRRLQAPQ
ncbi:MAG: tetratricopeptide repeat protein [Acidobacteria bacterium]|nr:tetratricopeptide repeat protein [Acidobacteriota bacterium]MDA1235684.1 tetratricopeptide repeat protein [Acidobacteriota bacterium]